MGTVKPDASTSGDTTTSTTSEPNKDEKVDDVDMVPENDITPVGLEYIEEITNDEGKLKYNFLLGIVF